MTSNIKLIAHRGNLFGSFPPRENHPSYIDEAIAAGFDVEIDLRVKDKRFHLGHDEPQYEVSHDWLYDRKDSLWLHCKEFAALFALQYSEFNYFFHDSDEYTLTSKNFMWSHPRAAKIKNTVHVIQGRKDDEFAKTIISSQPLGICSDYVARIRGLLEKGE